MVIVALWLLACGGGGGPPGDGSLPTEGAFSLVTYNVAGLPEGISSSQPERYMPLISPLLNGYDLVVVQEDFAYHAELSAQAEHPYQSTPKEPLERYEGDGLARFSQSAFTSPEHQQWRACNGLLDGASDCLAEKGFSLAEHTLGARSFTLVNLHAEAGGGDDDKVARADNIVQLLARLDQVQGALIVAGDTNLHGDDADDRVVLDSLLEGAGLEDACEVMDCGVDTIDRVMVRSGADLSLIIAGWSLPEEFLDEDGNDLSDHVPVMVSLEWAVP